MIEIALERINGKWSWMASDGTIYPATLSGAYTRDGACHLLHLAEKTIAIPCAHGARFPDQFVRFFLDNDVVEIQQTRGQWRQEWRTIGRFSA